MGVARISKKYLKISRSFNIDDAAANDVIQRKQHRKEKKNKLEFHSSHWCYIRIVVEERLGILFFISMARTLS